MLLQCIPTGSNDDADIMLLAVMEYMVGIGRYLCKRAGPNNDDMMVSAAEIDVFVCRVGTPLLVRIEALGEGVTVYNSQGVAVDDEEYIPCTLSAPAEEDEEQHIWSEIRSTLLLPTCVCACVKAFNHILFGITGLLYQKGAEETSEAQLGSSGCL